MRGGQADTSCDTKAVVTLLGQKEVKILRFSNRVECYFKPHPPQRIFSYLAKTF